MTIGQWVRRRDARQKWHLIDSVVDDEPFTRCGRRLRRKAKGFDTSDVMPLTRLIGQPQNCFWCSSPGTVRASG